jgi:hypothetical protein
MAQVGKAASSKRSKRTASSRSDRQGGRSGARQPVQSATKRSEKTRSSSRRGRQGGRSAPRQLVQSARTGELRINTSAPSLGKLAPEKRRLIEQGFRRYGETLEAEAETLASLTPAAVRQVIREVPSAAHAAIVEQAGAREHSSGIRALSVPARRATEEAGQAVARLLAELAERYEMSAAALKEQASVVVRTAHAILSGREHVFDVVMEALAVQEHLNQEDVEQLNEARLLALHNRVMAESHTGKKLEEWGLQRQRLHQLRQESRLFAISVPQQRGFLYPRWQFDPETRREREGLSELITAAKDLRIDPLSFHLIMTNADAGNGKAPLELLESGEVNRVEAILRANAV